MIGRWVRAERDPIPGSAKKQSALILLSTHTELLQLRQENEQLQMCNGLQSGPVTDSSISLISQPVASPTQLQYRLPGDKVESIVTTMKN